MSKSLKNFITIKDLLGISDNKNVESYSADDFRMLCSTTPYGNTLDYNPLRLAQCKNDLKAVQNFFNTIQRTLQQTELMKQHHNTPARMDGLDMNNKTEHLIMPINQIKPNIVNNVTNNNTTAATTNNFEDTLLTSFLAAQNNINQVISK
eukprot:UN08534